MFQIFHFGITNKKIQAVKTQTRRTQIRKTQVEKEKDYLQKIFIIGDVFIQDLTNSTNAVYIPSIDGKDLVISNNLLNYDNTYGYSLLTKDDCPNLRKFINTLDYSLDLIRMRKVYKTIYRNRYFSFLYHGKEYTTRVINVTFKYSNKLYNPIGKNTYIHHRYRGEELNFRNNLAFSRKGELLGVRINTPLIHSLDMDTLKKISPYFKVEGDVLKVGNIPTIKSRSQIREELYKNGFYCDGVHYVRYKRSSGSARVGKCLFIDEKLYPSMHRYDMCGIKIDPQKPIDLAALESYIALTSSSIVDTLEIDPKSILVIDDYESTFKNNVIATRIVDCKLQTAPEEVEITNSIWDGQSLMDSSLFTNYSQYGMLLLRNRFFKSCCFNTNIQKFFTDNNITSVEQLNGFTLAKSIEEIKLITTPSSIKYLKFGRLKQWLQTIDSTFGIVKHDKPTHYIKGRMVQTHYQLINTLQLTPEETVEFLTPELNYIGYIRKYPAVLREHLRINPNDIPRITAGATTSQIVFQLLSLNDNFGKTRMYDTFVQDLVKSLKSNIKSGHVLVNGNYSTLLGNPYEMLLSSIGQFTGESLLGPGNVHTRRFPYDTDILGTRSPHTASGCVLVTHNKASEELDAYFNLSEQIICINAINENILQRLAGAD